MTISSLNLLLQGHKVVLPVKGAKFLRSLKSFSYFRLPLSLQWPASTSFAFPPSFWFAPSGVPPPPYFSTSLPPTSQAYLLCSAAAARKLFSILLFKNYINFVEIYLFRGERVTSELTGGDRRCYLRRISCRRAAWSRGQEAGGGRDQSRQHGHTPACQRFFKVWDNILRCHFLFGLVCLYFSCTLCTLTDPGQEVPAFQCSAPMWSS